MVAFLGYEPAALPTSRKPVLYCRPRPASFFRSFFFLVLVSRRPWWVFRILSSPKIMTTTTTTTTTTSVDFDSCLVLYATQSGRARACARRTSRILAEQAQAVAAVVAGDDGDDDGGGCTRTTCTPNFHVSASGYRSMDDKYCGMSDVVDFATTHSNNHHDPRTNKSTLLVFFISTTGDGEQPDSMQHIWKQLYVVLYFEQSSALKK